MHVRDNATGPCACACAVPVQCVGVCAGPSVHVQRAGVQQLDPACGFLMCCLFAKPTIINIAIQCLLTRKYNISDSFDFIFLQDGS